RIVLFGAGNLGRQVLTRLREDGIEPLCFADNRASAWGTTIDSLRVLSPTDAAKEFGSRAVFIVTIWNVTHRYLDTQQQLRLLGCKWVMPVTSVRWKYHQRFLPYLWEDLPQNALRHADAIRAAYRLWSDGFSRREYVGQIAWRIRGDFSGIAPPVKQES